MPTSCVAYGCNNRHKSGSGVSFHRFPHKKPELLEKWIQAVRRQDWKPSQQSYICGVHFAESCFVQTGGKIGRHLKPGSIPTIFPAFPKHLQQSVRKRRSPVKRKQEVSPSKIRKTIASEHTYNAGETSQASNLHLIKVLSRKNKVLKQKVRRRNKKIKELNSLLETLKEKQLVAEKQASLLEYNFSGVAKEIFANQLKNPHGGIKQGHRYSKEIKQFAMTLHYYSPNAYDFVRKLLSLPHASSLRAWASSVDCEPGYLTNVIKILGEAAQINPFMKDVTLIVDAMTLHKGTFWDPKSKSFVGRVDYGIAVPEASDDLATEVLVFMAVGLTGHWKHPIAYVFQDKCSAAVQTQLIKDCIELLHSEDIRVCAVVFDGTFTNQLTAQKLGCKMRVSDMQTWFPHPRQPAQKVYVIFDACHMLKLMRNLLADYQVISENIHGTSYAIKWEYIEALNSLQEEIGLTFANKIKKKHIDWTKHKMNVKLAAQTLSASVASAIDFLRDEIEAEEFQGSEATSHFIQKIDMAFDFLNSRNPFAKGAKAAVRAQTLPHFMAVCKNLYQYIFNLRDDAGRYLRNGRRKTCVWGFAFTLQSTMLLCHELLTRDFCTYKYVLTYKLSQDHLELLFNKIRRRFGWNNNPNVLEFKQALKRIIIRNSIQPSNTGNCTNFEDSLCETNGLLDFSWKRRKLDQQSPVLLEDESPDMVNLDTLLIQMDQQHCNILRDNILYYIAGYIVRRLLLKLDCESCHKELLLKMDDPAAMNLPSYPVYSRFTHEKQRGGLVFPSCAVLKIIKATEVIFRQRVIDTPKEIVFDKMIDLKIQSAVIHQLGTSMFSDSPAHYFDHRIGQEADHLSSLARNIISAYLNLRLKMYGKKYTSEVAHGNVTSTRHLLTKQILFRNQ